MTPRLLTFARLTSFAGDEETVWDVEVPPGDYRVALPSLDGPPSAAHSVRFYDLISVEVPDPRDGSQVLCLSEPFWQTPGSHFYSGDVLGVGATRVEAYDLPLLTSLQLSTTMRQKGWSHVILFDNRSFRFFRPGIDTTR